jgi:type I restriction enzyme S subunit
MEKFNLIFPKRLSEQKAIASILSSCDKTIDDTQKLIEKIELRHKALCQQLLTGKKRVEGSDNEIEKIQIQEFASQYSTKNKEDKKLIVLSCTKYN